MASANTDDAKCNKGDNKDVIIIDNADKAQFSSRFELGSEVAAWLSGTGEPSGSFDFWTQTSRWAMFPGAAGSAEVPELLIDPVEPAFAGTFTGAFFANGSNGQFAVHGFGEQRFRSGNPLPPMGVTFGTSWNNLGTNEHAITSWTGAIYEMLIPTPDSPDDDPLYYTIMVTNWTRIDVPTSTDGLRSATSTGTDFWQLIETDVDVPKP